MPDYLKYSLEELYDAYEHIDKEQYPDRIKIILEEIDKRKKEVLEKNEKAQQKKNEPAKLWMLRGFAFIIDYLLVIISIGIINNLISFPTLELFISIGSVIFFCAYFAFTEGRGTRKASPGKRIIEIHVVSQNDEAPHLRAIVARSAIIAAMIIFDWDELLALFHLPIFMAVLAWTIPIGFALYNIWLAIFSSDHLMLQDRLTNTNVVSTSERLIEQPEFDSMTYKQKSKLPKPVLAIVLIVAMSVLGLVFTQLVYSFVGEGNIWKFPNQDSLSVQTIVEKHIANEMGIRSQVSIKTTKTATWENVSQGTVTKRSLEITIWIPAILWNKATRDKLTQIALEPLNVTKGYYDSGTLEIWTGFEYLEIKHSFDLTVP